MRAGSGDAWGEGRRCGAHRGVRRRECATACEVQCSEVYPVERGPVSFERKGNEKVCFTCDDGNVYTRLCVRDVLTMG